MGEGLNFRHYKNFKTTHLTTKYLEWLWYNMHNKYIYFGISLVALIFKPKLLRWPLPYLCACGKKVIFSFDKFQFFPYKL